MAEEFRNMKIISEPHPDDGRPSASTKTEPVSTGTIPQVPAAKVLVQQSIFLEKLAPEYLLHIYQYLEPLDVANASMASDYLANFAESHVYKAFADCRISAYQHDNLDVKLALYESGHNNIRIRRPEQDIYNWDQFKMILQNFGAHIKRIRFDGNSEIVFENVLFAVQHCPHLEVLHLENIDNACSGNALQDVQCYAKKAILDDVEIRPNVFPKFLPNLTAVSIYRFNKDDIRHVVNGASTLERLTLADGTINFDLFHYLEKHRDTLNCLALIEIKFTGNRYTGIADLFPKLEQLQISVASQEDLDALAGMNIKYLQLVLDDQFRLDEDEDETTSTTWSLHGLPLLEELDLVSMGDRVLVHVPSVRVISVDYFSSRVQNNIADLPNLQRLCKRFYYFDVEELESVLKLNFKETKVELEFKWQKDMPKFLEFLTLRFFILKTESPAPPPLVRIIGNQSQIQLLDTGSLPPNVQLASVDYCKQMEKFDPMPQTLHDEAGDFFDLKIQNELMNFKIETINPFELAALYDLFKQI